MAKARPSSSEIDRFLEEVNRRKQQQARQAAPPVVQPPPPPPRPRAVQQPKAQKVQQRQILVDEPVIRAVVVEPMPEPLRDFTPRASTSAYQLPTKPPELPRGAESAPVHHAKALMRTRDGMRAMFVLNEILSPPRCKRTYRRDR